MKLSICISTYNRGAFITQTLDSIFAQILSDVEVIVVDGASPDNTEEVLRECCRRWPSLRYYRESVNSGVDADYDKAVGYSIGEYCWLMSDDDVLEPGALARVLQALADQPDLVVVDAAMFDAELARPLQSQRMKFSGTRVYGRENLDQLMVDAGDALSFIGGTIISRELWMSRDRERYFGSLFIHVGVIFQKPVDRAILIGDPLIKIRFGNAMWTARSFEIWMFLWPNLIWSFCGYSDAAKRTVCVRQPWRQLRMLVGYRANGAYSLTEYKRFFSNLTVGYWRIMLLIMALVPGRLVNLMAVTWILITGGKRLGALYILTEGSRYSNVVSRGLSRICTRALQ